MNKLIKDLLFYKTFLRKSGRTINVIWNQLVGGVEDILDNDGISTEWDGEHEVITNLSRDSLYSLGSQRGYILDDKNNPVIIDKNAYYFILCSEFGCVIVDRYNNHYQKEAILKFVNSTLSFRVTKYYDFINTHPIGDVTQSTCILINLTKMYGAGNEPLTTEEFEADCALNGIDLTQYQEYDEGTERKWKLSKRSHAGNERNMMMISPFNSELDFEQLEEEREVNNDEGLMQNEEGDEYNSEHLDEAD